MVDSIDPRIGPISPNVGKTQIGKVDAPAGSKSFRDVFNEQINLVNDYLLEAGKAQEDLAAGRTDNVDEVFAQVKKAELQFKTLMEVRNKLLDAYQEIMRMRT